MPLGPLTPAQIVQAIGLAFVLIAFIAIAVSRFLLRRRLSRTQGQLQDAIDTFEGERAKVESDHAEAMAAVAAERTAFFASIDDRQQEADAKIREGLKELEALRADVAPTKVIRDRLLAETTQLEEDAENISVGLYRPHFDYKDSGQYKVAIDRVRAEMKKLVKDDAAVVVEANWTVDYSASAGTRMQKQYAKCMLRAFNGECDAAASKVTWSNIVTMETRIEKAFESINKFGEVARIHLAKAYLDLRLQELRLVHEHENKKREEAEEQRRIREQMREEERVLQEIEREKQEAEAEERRFAKALELARKEAASASGAQLQAANDRMRLLEAQLQEAHARGERAKSQAELTKQGHIYVISNIGSFGEDVVKVGMTRRLDPIDRVRELGDASVPFEFDVHAMFFSDDAPALEAALHRELATHRVNFVNLRKEFFRVSVDQIEACAASMGVNVELTKLAEAREYRETLAMRTAQNGGASQ